MTSSRHSSFKYYNKKSISYKFINFSTCCWKHETRHHRDQSPLGRIELRSMVDYSKASYRAQRANPLKESSEVQIWVRFQNANLVALFTFQAGPMPVFT